MSKRSVVMIGRAKSTGAHFRPVPAAGRSTREFLGRATRAGIVRCPGAREGQATARPVSGCQRRKRYAPVSCAPARVFGSHGRGAESQGHLRPRELHGCPEQPALPARRSSAGGPAIFPFAVSRRLHPALACAGVGRVRIQDRARAPGQTAEGRPWRASTHGMRS